MAAASRRWSLILALVAALGATVAITAMLRHDHHQHVAGRVETRHVLSPPPPSPPPLTRPLIEAARWERTPLGFRLRVKPSLYGRNHALSSPPTALDQAIRAAAPTPLDLSRSIRRALTEQLRCHAEFAATKPRWDLEAWRPDVSYVATVDALCNP